MPSATEEGYTYVELRTLNGPEYRRVSTQPPRLPTENEIPIIDLSPIDGDLQSRKELASQIRKAAQSTGFFYVKNHGLPEDLIGDALSQIKRFFAQSDEEKEKVSYHKSEVAEGYHGVGSTQVNLKETKG
jgi:isopenicillin N synthase-like dioxygenase